MDSNFESRSPDNADKETLFPKYSTDKAKRKYRRHSSGSGSASPMSDSSPKRGRSPSPDLSKENFSRKYDAHLKRKDGGRELDMESGRGGFEKDSGSRRHSDKQSYRSSRDYHKDDEYDRYHKRDEDKDKSYHKRDGDKDRYYPRSSGYGRESRNDSRSDRTRQVSERDRSGDYRQSKDKYTHEKSYAEGHRGMDNDREERRKHKDEESIMERGTSGKKHADSKANDSKYGDRDRQSKDREGRDDRRGYGKNLADHKSKHTGYDEEGTRQRTKTGKESTGSYMEESEQKVDQTEKRKHDVRESGRHKERFSREIAGKLDNDSSPGTFKLLHTDKDKNNGNDGQSLSKFTVSTNEKPPPSSKMAQETADKVVKEPAQSCSNEAAASQDFNAAKDAALKAAELVNRNLVGGGYMSTDQKKKLLWGSKKNTAVEEPGHRWDVPIFSDRERQEKFNKLMSLRLPWCLWPIVGCEGRSETGVQTRQCCGWQRRYPIRKAGTAPVGFREAIHCWTPAKRWPYGRTWSVNFVSASEYSLSWIFAGVFHPCYFKDPAYGYPLAFCFKVFGKRCLLLAWLNLDIASTLFKKFVVIIYGLVKLESIMRLIWNTSNLLLLFFRRHYIH